MLEKGPARLTVVATCRLFCLGKATSVPGDQPYLFFPHAAHERLTTVPESASPNQLRFLAFPSKLQQNVILKRPMVNVTSQ